MSSNDDIAYLVPKSTWERQRELLENAKQQRGGAVTGINADDSVDANALLRAMAVNMSLAQNPRAEFVKEADSMIKKILSNPKLTPEEKVDYLNAYSRTYADQRRAALAGPTGVTQETTQAPAAPQPPTPPPPPSQPPLPAASLTTPTRTVRSTPPPPYMTEQASTSGLKKTPKRLAHPYAASAKKKITMTPLQREKAIKTQLENLEKSATPRRKKREYAATLNHELRQLRKRNPNIVYK